MSSVLELSRAEIEGCDLGEASWLDAIMATDDLID